ncbi:MAG: CPBP family intramembrane metalloprotease [Gemmatimonadota bacterium]|nr:MAG: CPBP family intramembrane metalloprotease [Gemmatimonadota bacterium]
MDRASSNRALPSARESWAALAYFALYLTYLFAAPESELLHWLSLVVLPLALLTVLHRGSRSLQAILSSFGLQRGNLGKGVGWALLLGTAFGIIQVLLSGNSAEIQDAIQTGRALYLLPLGLALMMLTAGFTEEFFFRGFLQTRIQVLLRSRWLAVLIVALLFGVYHLPYAYFNPNWPSAGDWSAAWAAAMGNGVPGGLVLGALYVKSDRNLIAPVVLHSMIGAFPAMTLLRISF